MAQKGGTKMEFWHVFLMFLGIKFCPFPLRAFGANDLNCRLLDIYFESKIRMEIVTSWPPPVRNLCQILIKIHFGGV